MKDLSVNEMLALNGQIKELLAETVFYSGTIEKHASHTTDERFGRIDRFFEIFDDFNMTGLEKENSREGVNIDESIRILSQRKELIKDFMGQSFSRC